MRLGQTVGSNYTGGVVRGEALCAAPVSVPGESVSGGSRVLSFWTAGVLSNILVTLFSKF